MIVTKSDSSIQVRLFGVPELSPLSRSSVFPSRGFCLLAMLSLAPTRRVTRAQAAAQLWDNGDTASNLLNMRQLILRMKKTAPEIGVVLGVNDSSLWLTGAAGQIDICRFLEMDCTNSQKTLDEIIKIYRGDLLGGLEISTESLSESMTIENAYLRERYFSLVHEALKGLTHYGDADLPLLRAVEQHALSIDRTREDTYRALIAAYGAIGKPEECRRVYALLTGVLRLDGEAGPIPDTKVSFAQATARTLSSRIDPMIREHQVPTHLPRVALLAPNWISPGFHHVNVVRALVEDIANELAKYKGLVTLASHSSFQARNDGGVLEENSVLRADYTLGSFVRPGEGLGTFCVRLVGGKSGFIIWSSEFSLKYDLLLESGRRLIARIASEISGAVESDTFKRLERTGNSSSYLSYLKAQNALKTCDLRSVRRARRWYADAIKEDGRFAEAYSGVSCSLYLEWLLLGGNDPKLLSEARELAKLAVSYDPSGSSGYWREAMVALYQHDFDRSEQCFQKAQEFHPNSADILLDHSDAMGFVGDANVAWGMFERAIDLNPTPPDHYWWAGASIAFSKAKYAEAIELCDKLDNDESVLRLLAASHGQLGNTSEAREYGRRLMETYPGESAESMTRLQPHRSKQDLQPFIEGLRLAGIK